MKKLFFITIAITSFRFIKAQQAFFFRLSNKILVIAFIDKSELVMNSTTGDISYFSKTGEEKKLTVENIWSSNDMEVAKRMKYAKNLIIHFLNSEKTESEKNTKRG